MPLSLGAIGPGRPAKTAEAKALGGWAGKDTPVDQRPKRARGRSLRGVPRVKPPNDLPEPHLHLWRELAPHAEALGTLTPASVRAFCMVLEVMVVKGEVMKAMMADGLMVKRRRVPEVHPLMTRYTGLLVRVEQGLHRFGLMPRGESMNYGAVPEGETDPFAAFEGTGEP